MRIRKEELMDIDVPIMMIEDPVTFQAYLPDLAALYPADPEHAAKHLYAYLYRVAESWGYKPEIELGIYSPDERQSESGNAWWVMWESGPYDWGLTYTMDGKDRTYADGWFCECYWGFDVIFVPN